MQKRILVLMLAAGFALAGCGGGGSGSSPSLGSIGSPSGTAGGSGTSPGTSGGGGTASSGSGSGSSGSSGSGGSGSGSPAAETVLYAFGTNGSGDGSEPSGTLVMDPSGNLYGTTALGGSNNTGTVFEWTPAGVEHVLYAFGPSGGTDGYAPNGALTIDATGHLFGTTQQGGAGNALTPPTGLGAVFRISPAGVESLLHSFVFGSTPPDGSQPFSGVIQNTAGDLFGTTSTGGANGTGAVYEITAAGSESLLHSFGPTGSGDGANPYGGLIMDASGDLFGETSGGGANGTGAVFEIQAGGSESVLYSFGATGGGDGSDPVGSLSMDAAGNLYGATQYGGANGTGTIFELTTAGREQILHSFGAAGSGDGNQPNGNLLINAAGDIFGTTSGGGSSRLVASGGGEVFEITPTGSYSVLYEFGQNGGSDGTNPGGGLIEDSSGNLYGTTVSGGDHGAGTIFRITP